MSENRTSHQKIPISVLIQTKNEAAAIESCISSLVDFDEIIVVDSQSDDCTPQLARSAGAEVVNFTWNGQYPKKKQWQLDNVETRHHWILFLDADKSPTTELIDELRSIAPELAEERFSAYDLELEYWFAGRRLEHGHRVHKRSLVHRKHTHFPELDDLEFSGMGELEGHYQPLPTGPVRRLRARLCHNDQDPVTTWFARHNRYSDWEARLRYARTTRQMGSVPRSSQGRLFERAPFKPLLFFVYCFVARLGILDGRAGFDYAFALATYYWQIGVKYRELQRSGVVSGGRRDLLGKGSSSVEESK